jgi:hypothetical protein
MSSLNVGRIPNIASNLGANVSGFFKKNVSAAAVNMAANVTGNAKALPVVPILFAILGVILLVFVFLVIYNKTIGDRVRDGWNALKKRLQLGTDVAVDVGPGLSATLTPEPTVILPPLTATLLPEPVTVPTEHDEPPHDAISIPASDRPAGMPGSSLSSSLSSAIAESITEKLPSKKEVFNISRNIYTFNDAAAVCSAAGADLATYDQVKEAYDHGADWCNYGWIKGQMAVYPTQKSTYEKLQKGPAEFHNACGVPGINGGYFDNPELRFGVNCYGVKPAQKASDEVLDSQVALPQSPAEIEFEKQVQKFRDQMDSAVILPFHKGRWTS